MQLNSVSSLNYNQDIWKNNKRCLEKKVCVCVCIVLFSIPLRRSSGVLLIHRVFNSPHSVLCTSPSSSDTFLPPSFSSSFFKNKKDFSTIISFTNLYVNASSWELQKTWTAFFSWKETSSDGQETPRSRHTPTCCEVEASGTLTMVKMVLHHHELRGWWAENKLQKKRLLAEIKFTAKHMETTKASGGKSDGQTRSRWSSLTIMSRGTEEHYSRCSAGWWSIMIWSSNRTFQKIGWNR